MKRRLQLSIVVISIVLISFAPLALAQGRGDSAIETLAARSKIIASDLVLEDFLAGSQTTRVIVTLAEPNGFRQTATMRKGLESTSSHLSHEGGDIKVSAFRNDLQAAVQETQDRVIKLLEPSKVQITNRFVYIFGFSAEVTLEGLKEIEALNEVTSISKDVVLHKHLAQGIPLMNASSVRSTYDGSGIAIAICDTGIDTSHPALGGGGSPLFNSKVIGGYDTGDNDSDPRPHATNGDPHGTACAGIAAGDIGSVGDYIGGVAPNAKLYAVKITHGDSGSAYISDMIEGWEWCVTHQNDDPNNPIMVISTSLGSGYFSSTCDGASPAMTTAAANAVAAGVTLFASTGNAGFCEAIEWPACITHVNAVGAVYDANIGENPRPGFVGCISNLSCVGYDGPCPEKTYKDATTAADQVPTYSNSATFMDLFAPSNNAYTTDIVGSAGYASGDYTSSFGGTSAACPYAAGAAASLQSAAKEVTGSFLSPNQVRFILTSTGDTVTDPKASPTVTIQRVNLQAAVNEIGAPPGGMFYIIPNKEGGAAVIYLE